MYILTGLSHEAVIVFFVISGLLVGGTSLVRLPEKGITLGIYWCHRFSRIYVVYLPALLIGFVLDSAGYRFFNQSKIYSGNAGAIPSAFKEIPSRTLTIPDFLANLFQLQTIVAPPLGSNGPLWSLACEWWYYVAFSLTIVATLSKLPLTRLSSLACLTLLAVVLPTKMTLYGIIWLFGALTMVAIKKMHWKPSVITGAAIFVATLAISRLGRASSDNGLAISWLLDSALALGFCALILSLSRAEGAPRPIVSKFHAAMADFSYTTYLVHYPMLVLLIGAGTRVGFVKAGAQPSIAAYSQMGVIVVVLLLWSYGFSRVTEVYTKQVRIWLEWMLPSGPTYACTKRSTGVNQITPSRRG